jgi:hypothetical protein
MDEEDWPVIARALQDYIYFAANGFGHLPLSRSATASC